MGLDTNPLQLVASSISSNNLRKASEVMNYAKLVKAFNGMSFMVQIGLWRLIMNSYNIFIWRVRQKKFKVPDYYMKCWTMYYD